MIKMQTSLSGSWGGVLKGLDFLGKRFDKALDEAMKKETKRVKKEIKKEIRGKGKTKYSPLSKLTIAIRRAKGISSRKPGIATRTVLNNVDYLKVARHQHFAGVKRGVKHPGSSGFLDVADVANMLEEGRPSYTITLDKPGASGKTPRQFFWWLYLQGVIKAPPKKTTKHLVVKETPPRPFVRNVWKREQETFPKKLEERIVGELKKEFSRRKQVVPVPPLPKWR